MARRHEIGETLRQRVLSALHFGTLRPDGRLPSARALAAELRADPRVVTAAYRQLEREGVVERRPPSRAHFVVAGRPAAGAPAPTTEWLVEVFAGSLARGLAAPDFPEHARRALETLRIRAACVECNDDQLTWLCRELHEDYGVLAAPVDVAALDAAAPGAPALLALRAADLVVAGAAHADAAARAAAAAGKPLVVAAVRPDLAAEVERLLAAGPLYFVGTDPRFEAKLRATYRGPHARNLRVALVGRDDVAAIPAGTPAYVMRTARDQLGGVPAQLRPLSTLRAFSAETQRAILRFVLRTNEAALRALG